MTLSTLDLFSIGIGPSSSHTVGPMRAAKQFAARLRHDRQLDRIEGVRVELFGSLSATGRGHGSDRAIVLGLEGESPETVDTTTAEARFHGVVRNGRLALNGTFPVAFDIKADLLFSRSAEVSAHPNGMRFTAFDHDGSPLRSSIFYSIGGGFIVDESGHGESSASPPPPLPHVFGSAEELLAICRQTGLRISDVMLENELALHSETELRTGISELWQVMKDCVSRGCESDEPLLPGKLNVPRRAPALLASLKASDQDQCRDAGEWLNLYALAVNEENAAGGRVVTAPTNGAAGIVPAVLHYYANFVPNASEEGIFRFFLTAAAIGFLFKNNASISGAEVGCQGEVGSACSMAAAALCEALGGTPAQVENAAEIGIEHHLGLTCDPVGGLVQIPCIERNAIASNTAVTAARLALRGDGSHLVSLDTAILTMRQTGQDMKVKYKETSRGGLAINVVEC
jgi:L-serine dehydratase